MTIDVSKIKPHLKRLGSLLLVCLLIYGAFLFLTPQIYRFNPQYLVENSILKKKNFASSVQEIISPRLNIKAFLYEEHSNPIVSVSVIFKKAGSAYEPDSKAGIGRVLADMLLKGAGQYSNEAFNEILEQKAIQLNFNNNKDNFYATLKFIKKDQETAAKMFNLALQKPTFAAKYLRESKQDAVSSYWHQTENPDYFLLMQAAPQIYGKHPYHRSAYGLPAKIKNITIFDLKNYMRQKFTKDNLIVGISGDLSAEEAESLLDKMFAGISSQKEDAKLSDVQIDFAAPKFHLDKKLPQVVGYFYAKGVAETNPDYYPLKLALEIFSGGGLTSRIQKSVREDKGLTYGVYGQIVNYDKANLIIGRFSSTPQKISQLMTILQKEWLKMGEQGVTETELEQVKSYLTASEPLRYADIDTLSATLAYMQKKELGLDFLQKRNDYINNVTLKDINRIAKQYFTEDNLRFMTIGKIDEGSK